MSTPEIDLERVAEVLRKHGVDYVMVGGLAVVLHGGETTTQDIDLAFESSFVNFERLADALQELEAKPKRWNPGEFRLQRSDLASQWLHLESSAGDIDLLERTPGVPYEELRLNAEQFSVGSSKIEVASLRDLITMKTVAGRSKDAQHLAELEAIVEIRKGLK